MPAPRTLSPEEAADNLAGTRQPPRAAVRATGQPASGKKRVQFAESCVSIEVEQVSSCYEELSHSEVVSGVTNARPIWKSSDAMLKTSIASKAVFEI